MSPWTRFCPVAHPDQRRSKRSLGKIIIDKGGDDGDDDDDDLKNEYVLGVIEYMQYNLLACSGLNCNAHLISWRNPRGPVADLLFPLLPTFHCAYTVAHISLEFYTLLHLLSLPLLFVLYLEMDLDVFVLPFSLNSLSVHLLSITDRLQPLGIEQTKQIIRNGNLSSELSDISLN